MKALLLLVALISPLAASAANVDDMRTVVQTLRGKATDNTTLERIANAFAQHWAIEFNGYVADQENPTVQERAGFFLLKMRGFARDIIVSQAKEAAQEEAAAGINAAGEVAAEDID